MYNKQQQSPRSPRKALSAEEKRLKDKPYRVQLSDFVSKLQTISQTSNALIVLSGALGLAGKDHSLKWNNVVFEGVASTQPYTMSFTRKDLRAAVKDLNDKIKDLKNFLRVSQKKQREKEMPESFKGVYTPVYAADALKAFYTLAPENFGPLSPELAQVRANSLESNTMIREKRKLVNEATARYQSAYNAYGAMVNDMPNRKIPTGLMADALADYEAQQEEADNRVKEEYHDSKEDYELYSNHVTAYQMAETIPSNNTEQKVFTAYENYLRTPVYQFLPRLMEGYLLRNTSTMSFYVYAHQNDLQRADNAQFTRTDDIMTRAFGGSIPSAYFSVWPNGVKLTKKTKAIKTTMNNAVSQRLIPAPVNTYEAVRLLYPYPRWTEPKSVKTAPVEVSFKPNDFNTYYFQNIAADNYYSKTETTTGLATVINELAGMPGQEAKVAELKSAYENLDDKEIRDAMVNEHNIVKSVSKEWENILISKRKQQKDSKKKIKQ